MLGKAFFAERFLSGARQSLCRAPKRHSAKKSDGHGGSHGVTFSLPSASNKTLGKEQTDFFKKNSLPSASSLALGKEQTDFF
jgi:hypothetical protein